MISNRLQGTRKKQDTGKNGKGNELEDWRVRRESKAHKRKGKKTPKAPYKLPEKGSVGAAKIKPGRKQKKQR